MQSWTKRDFFTYLSLFVLLFIRFPFAEFASLVEKIVNPSILLVNIENLRLLEDQTYYLYDNYSFILVLVVIIVNRSNLKELNIDKIFIPILLSGGMSYHWTSSGLWLVVIDLLIFSIAILYVRGRLKFGDIEPRLLCITFVIVIVFFLGILLIIDSMNFAKIGWAVQWYKERISFLIVEEVTFRGLLWMFLKKLNFSEFKIVVLQAILFWLSHVYYANDNLISFWVVIPIVSVVLGIVVWRTRSITSSTIAHILFNAWWSLYVYRNL